MQTLNEKQSLLYAFPHQTPLALYFKLTLRFLTRVWGDALVKKEV